ncbi:11644_t:CDS:10 [Funneliformis geosporum]|uniref:11644_t:CDS:1 n=1 Tax=Funneliformis geosporum TaxID=1117311 RepID=A0A9W4SZK7_9GLOM|nr:11644_t:CDS:10 [Funneliformis geosporum]
MNYQIFKLLHAIRQRSFKRPSSATSIRSLSTSTIIQPESRFYGQPTAETHPHLMKPGETTPGISAVEYELRRTKLMNKLPENSVAISLGYRTRYMSNKVLFVYYSFNEPDAAMVLEKNNSQRGYKMTMFVPPKNRSVEIWDGPRTGLLGAVYIFGADEAMESSRFNSKIKEIAKNYKDVYIDLPPRTNILSSESISKSISRTHGIPSLYTLSCGFKCIRDYLDRLIRPHRLSVSNIFGFQVKPLSRIVQELRIIKSDAEISLMKKGGQITGKAFIETMNFTKPGLSEHDLSAKVEFECRIRGAQYLAYVPVVAGGINALTMHYVRNDMPLRNGDLILMDAGGEYHGYASDVTRTWPINGKFSPPQRELYEAVLNVNRKCIKLCTEKQNISLNGVHEQSVQFMKEELSNLGFNLVEGDVDRVLYPHHVGHYLGLDVHDTHDLDRSRSLKSGMVLTIEPGIYIPPNNAYPKQYHSIGVRIEDDVLVGETDPYVLSSTAPKEIDDIEYCMEN